jgi:hypothetical protein
LKAFISISLLVLFISNNIFKAAIIFNYWHNKVAIIENCCINKNKPELNCNGKCYVGSELTKLESEKEENTSLRMMLQDFEMILSCTESNTHVQKPVLKNWINMSSNSISIVWLESVFHPPTC